MVEYMKQQKGSFPSRKALPHSQYPFLLASKTMEKCSSNLGFVSMYHHHHLLLLLLLLSFLISSVKASSEVHLMENSTQDPVCAKVDCGEGRCIASNAGFGFESFDCECNPGWKKIQIGFLTFPACVVPNCTLDLQCGIGASPPSPPSPPPPVSLLPVLPPLPDLLDPCTYTWCGDGRCVANGPIGYTCQCNEGSANFLNNTSFACFKKCSFGADCMGLEFGQPPPPSGPSPSSTGSIPVPNCWSRLEPLTMVVFAAIFLTWV